MVDRRTFLSVVAGLGAVTLIGCSEDETPRPRATSASPTPSSSQTREDVNPRVTGTVAGDLNVPWGIAFLSTGDALVAQRDAGSIVRVSPGGRVRNMGEVRGSRGGGEGGLQGLALDPDDDSVVFAFVTTDEDDRVVRIELDGDRLGDITPILTGIPSAGFHHGGRLQFGPEGHLFVATGEAGNPPESQKRGRSAARSSASTATATPSTATRSATAPGPTATATSRASPSTTRAGSGPVSSAPTGSTSSTSSRRAGTTAGRGSKGSPTTTTTSRPRSPGRRTSAHRPAWRSTGPRRSSPRCGASASGRFRSTAPTSASRARTSGASTDASARSWSRPTRASG